MRYNYMGEKALFVTVHVSNLSHFKECPENSNADKTETNMER